ncbi:hypothetical protein AVEN_271633-1 [Araneus ventricosus]|uniref:Uncharacterized protein n=1 Tax=Araneus ventricosus TaxID=182803 RepID=A0A4Y2HGZ8_ARAVE|nr:hypothetical protein AVEN_271633-1 [Araneus ventricosus]
MVRTGSKREWIQSLSTLKSRSIFTGMRRGWWQQAITIMISIASVSKPDFTEDPPCTGLLYVKYYVEGQMSSRRCGAEVWRADASSGVVFVI